MDKRSVNSPKLGSPFPKGPMPASPVLYEKSKSRCVYGLIDFFRLRRSHSKKLISNGSGSNRNESDIDLDNMVHLLRNTDEKCDCTDKGVDDKDFKIDHCNAKAKEIKGENNFIEQQTKKMISTPKVKTVSSGPDIGGDMSRDHEKATKSCQRPRRLSRYGCFDVATVGHRKFSPQDLEHGSSKKLTSEMASQATSNQMHPQDKEHSGPECIGHSRHISADQINIQLDINEATEAFMNQNLIGEKLLTADKFAHRCKHFFDAIKILSSNKDLFINLIQDPNSILVTRIEDLRKSHAKKLSTGSSAEANQQKQSAIEASAKNLSGCHPQSFENLVRLKPSQKSFQNCEDEADHDRPQFGHSLKNIQQSARPALFALDGLKRMLKHARRLSAKEEQSKLSNHNISSYICDSGDFEKCNSATNKDTNRRNTGCKTASDTNETTASVEIKEEFLSKNLQDFESGARKEEASTCGRRLESSTLSKVRYANRNEHTLLVKDRKSHSKSSSSGKHEFPVKHRPKTWKEMMHKRDNDLLPVSSPQRTPEHGFVYPQKRFSPYGTWKAGKDKRMRNCRERDNSYLSSLRKNSEASELAHHEDQFHPMQILGRSKNTADKDLHDIEMHGSISSFENDSHPQRLGKMVETNGSETLRVNRPFGELFGLGVLAGRGSNQSIGITNSDMEAEASGLSKLVWDGHNLMSSSPTHECSSKTSREESVSIKDPGEHLSQLPILERDSVDDNTTPSSTESEKASSQQFGIEEDHRAGVLNDKHEFVLKNIYEVLQASIVNWDNLSANYHSNQFLGQILWYKLEGWLNQFHRDHNLLVDFIIEVLEYIHKCHFRYSPWLLFVLPKIRSHVPQESIVPEVMNYLSQHLNLCPPPRTLQQLVEKDLTRLEIWMDIGVNSDDIMAEMVESILEELMIEAAMD